MQNLAGDENCDEFIARELSRSRINAVQGKRSCREVPASITGKLGPFTFTRAWYYWMVSGPTPLAVAKELYADPVGRADVRVEGHCGCPAPEKPWTIRKDGEEFVMSYHIDTEVGLRLFTDTIRKHGLDK